MSDLFDLFDEPPQPEPTPTPKPVTPAVDFDLLDVAAARQAVERTPTPPPAPDAAQQPCATPYDGGHRCRVGGGLACFSDDNERTWFCAAHRPWGFFATERGTKPGEQR